MLNFTYITAKVRPVFDDLPECLSVQIDFISPWSIIWKLKYFATNLKTKTETETFSATETYFNQEIIPFNGPSLPIGKHEFPFSFTLPNNLASSFETATGTVYISGQ